MGISSFFKNMFNRRNVNINNLINISDSFVVPTRELFKENLEMLGLIETYKSEYKKVLSDKKLLFSMDLTNNINEDIRMYSELITNIFTKEKSLEGAIESKIKMFYKINKLNLYKEEIAELNEECTARLVALLELFNERKIFMSRHKKDALLFAINNLTSALVVFQAQRSAIEVEKESFLKGYAMLEISDQNDYEQKRRKFIQEKVKILNKVLLLFDKKVENEDLSYILMLERELEIYLYRFKDGANVLKDEINEYYSLKNNEQSVINFCNSEEIYDLERRVLLYFYYSKNLITLEDLYKLYELKLLSLIHGCHKVSRCAGLQSNLLYLLDIEKESYERCIDGRVNNIATGKNIVVQNIFGIGAARATKYILETCKINGKIDAGKILESKILRFLFSFDYEDGFIKFLNMTEVVPSLYKDQIDFNFKIFRWENFIPQTSIYELTRLGLSSSELDDNYYLLYKLYKQNMDGYKLPEGIKEINIAPLNECNHPIAKIFLKQIKGSKLILPDSLTRFCGQLFARNSIREIVLSDNIKTIGVNALSCLRSSKLSIPSTLESIVNDGVYSVSLASLGLAEKARDDDKDKFYCIESPLSNLKTIIFNDYKDSKILKDIKSLKQLFIGTLYAGVGNSKLNTSLKKIVFMENNEVAFSVDIKDNFFDIDVFSNNNSQGCNNVIHDYDVELCIKKIKKEVMKVMEDKGKTKKHTLTLS